MQTLYYDSKDLSVKKILAIAEFLQISLELNENVELAKQPEFAAKSPFGDLPVLETEKGTIFEEYGIITYLCSQKENPIYPTTRFEQIQLEQWCHIAKTKIDIPILPWYQGITGETSYNKQAIQVAKSNVRSVLLILNEYLKTRTYLVGETLSVADVVVASSLYPCFKFLFWEQFIKMFENLIRWYKTIINQPEMVKFFGEFQILDKEPRPQQQPKQPKQQQQKKKQPQQKKQQPKKEEEKKEEEKKEEETEKPKKKQNPLDLLPKSDFSLEDWKRVYSNSDTRTKALPWFYENFDSKGYCIYFSKYKYPEDLTKDFLACNLASGYVQRLESLRKYGFGSLCIVGKDSKYTIIGAWVFRGLEKPAELLECYDTESHEFTLADLSDPEQKSYFEDLLAWDGKLNGDPFVDGKTLK
ncbi:elongation factor 1-gamma [Anaeramoeba ignava]|uniref:Elongation factor 1-gamma n=1 Tax=Anaeramoeba ignava TaxID=1746090 RepID=A0A9Q0LDG6_ANAIG|nr:elongation factor 1-gamma [Anaeramoeba ignava]